MQKIKRIINRRNLYRKFFYTIYPVLMKQKLNHDMVVFESFLGRNYNDSPRAMFEYMREVNPNMEYVWIVNKPGDYNIEGATVIQRLSPKYFITIAKAKYIVNNSRMPIFFKKRKDQVYVQQWHGTPLKRLVYDMETNVMPGTNKDKYLQNFSREVSNWDYLVSPNHYSTEKFKTAFRFENQFLEVGYPRNVFLHTHTADDVKAARDKYGIGDEDIVILYTPTYRDNHNEGKGKYLQEINLDLEMLNNTPGIKVLLRTHYLVQQNLNLEKYPNIINVNDEQDINILYIASDALLNDYSSTMFDYLILNKPIILFPYDLKSYVEEIRGFYMDYNKIPAEQIDSTERLIEIAQNLKSYQSIWKPEMDEFIKEMVLPTEVDANKLIVKQMLGHKPNR
ncbi:CDP-glycerol glycerophosphotransferase family protein [Mollicutes bacterium LVI A0075]|nr:CDP-glycerol glycerophosphotransferase family protein [Mollicutes bacterium LVI A0075]